MQNTDLDKLVEFDEEKRTIVIHSDTNPIILHSVLTSLVMSNIEAIKEQMGNKLANATAYATLKTIADKYQEAYEDLRGHEKVQSDSIN